MNKLLVFLVGNFLISLVNYNNSDTVTSWICCYICLFPVIIAFERKSS